MFCRFGRRRLHGVVVRQADVFRDLHPCTCGFDTVGPQRSLYILPQTEFGKQVLLEAPDLEEVTPYQEEQRQLQRLVGHVGKTLTLLNPGGLVLVDGTRQHCESEGNMLEAGVPVEVIAVKGNRVVVRPVISLGPRNDFRAGAS